MLVVTVLVLELREVLHPDVFDGIIRVPDDQHLLLTLIDDSLFHHLKRIVVSALVYGSLIVLVCYLPIYLLQQFFRSTLYDCIFPIPFPTTYLWTTGQVAAEVRGILFSLPLVLLLTKMFLFLFSLLFLGCRGARHCSPVGGPSQDTLVQPPG
jgi:hypothetical protein